MEPVVDPVSLPAPPDPAAILAEGALIRFQSEALDPVVTALHNSRAATYSAARLLPINQDLEDIYAEIRDRLAEASTQVFQAQSLLESAFQAIEVGVEWARYQRPAGPPAPPPRRAGCNCNDPECTRRSGVLAIHNQAELWYSGTGRVRSPRRRVPHAGH